MGRSTFNEAHLMEELASKTKMSRVESLQFIGLFTEAIIGALSQGETVTLSNFGTLKAAVDAGRGRGKRYVSFRAGRRLKRALNPVCPWCECSAEMISLSTQYCRGDLTLAVDVQMWQCSSGCADPDGEGVYAFVDSALDQENERLADVAWREAFGEPLPPHHTG